MYEYVALILLFVFLVLGVPVAIALGLSGLIGIAMIAQW